MVSRSAVKPIFIGLGTAAVLAASAGPTIAEDSPSPSSSAGNTSASPSESASPSPTPTPKLRVTVTADQTRATAGEVVKLTTRVWASGAPVEDARILAISPSTSLATVAGDCPQGGCTLPSIKAGGFQAVTSTLSVSEQKLKKTTPITLTITADASGVTNAAVGKLTVTYDPVETASPSPTPTPTPTLSRGTASGPSDGKDGKNNNGSSSSGSSSGSSGGSGSGSSSSSSSSPGSGSPSYVPPSANSSFGAQSPQVALPPIAAPSPSVAPRTESITPESRLRNNKAPVAQDLTFERMASTQIAWLATLLVAFSLLLTQLRLGRRSSPRAAAAAEAARRARGTHRRPRKGIFGR